MLGDWPRGYRMVDEDKSNGGAQLNGSQEQFFDVRKLPFV